MEIAKDRLAVSTDRLYSKQSFCDYVPSSQQSVGLFSKFIICVSYEENSLIFVSSSDAPRLVLHYSVTFQIGPSFQNQAELNAFTTSLLSVLVTFKMFACFSGLLSHSFCPSYFVKLLITAYAYPQQQTS